ncbi:MAG: 6-phosphogluconolactonase [Fibrobacterota bacterium]|jgi:6-phosphogluconolactonase
MTVSVVVCKDLLELGEATLARVRGPVCAVSGGSTYEALFRHWSGPSLQGVSFIPVDERMVGLSEAGSNWMVAIRLLLDPDGLGHQALHWTPSASHLDALVRRLLPENVGRIPSIPQVWLGMGDDGHTASLFPNGPELSDTTSLALETVAPKAPHPRVTLGLGALRAALDLCVVVTGAAKGPMLRRVLDGDSSLPLALVLQGREATLFVNSECAKAAGI